MQKLLLLIASVSYLSLGNPTTTNIVELPNTFNGVTFSIENIVQVETLDSSVIVSCLIAKDLNFIDLISDYQSLRKIYGHGKIELNQNMEVTKSRFYMFKILNAPDRFIFVTPENDPIPNTIIADHHSVVDGKAHMDSILKSTKKTYFDHFENTIIYKQGLADAFERNEYIAYEVASSGDQIDSFYYEEDLYIQPMDYVDENTSSIFWEKSYESVSFYNGTVIGYHHLINKEDKTQKMSRYLNQQVVVYDRDGYQSQSSDLTWDNPMIVSNAIKVYKSAGLYDFTQDAESVMYLLREQSANTTKPSPKKHAYHTLNIDKNGNQLLSIPFTSELIHHKDYSMAVSIEDEQLLLSEFQLKLTGRVHQVTGNFHWFGQNRLMGSESKSITIEMDPVFKDDPIFDVKHKGSFELLNKLRCVVYEMEEMTEIHHEQKDKKDYFKTWFGFIVYNEQSKIVDFSVSEAYIPADKKSEISKMTCKGDELIFSLTTPNYFINSSKHEMIGQEVSLMKIDKNTGKIKKLVADIQIETK